jgi:hypothetical protein
VGLGWVGWGGWVGGAGLGGGGLGGWAGGGGGEIPEVGTGCSSKLGGGGETRESVRAWPLTTSASVAFCRNSPFLDSWSAGDVFRSNAPRLTFDLPGASSTFFSLSFCTFSLTFFSTLSWNSFTESRAAKKLFQHSSMRVPTDGGFVWLTFRTWSG